jgi:hypothetical protein
MAVDRCTTAREYNGEKKKGNKKPFAKTGRDGAWLACGPDQSIILISNQNLSPDAHFETQETHLHAPKSRCAA